MNKPERINLPEGVPYLNSFYFYLTHGCNLACRHCWLAPTFQKNGNTGGHLDFDLFKQAIIEGIPLGLSNAKLTGGEPLLHPDFLKMVDYLTAKELGVTIETNGMLLTKELAFYLKEQSTTWHVSVSIDGSTAESHDHFRGVNGAFEKSCQAVIYLNEVGFKPQIIMSIHEGNVHEITDVIKLAEELGAGSVKFNLVQSTGRGEKMRNRKEVLDTEDLYKLGKRVENDLQNKTPIRLFYSWPMAFHNIHNLLRSGSDTCGIFRILGILPSGLYAMCGIGMEIPELVYGEIGVDKLEDLWINNDTLSKVRKNIPSHLEGVCAKCIFKQQCLGYCIAHNFHKTRKLTSPFWFCHEADEMGIFPNNRLI